LIRVILVAPSPALRAGLRSLLSTDPEIRIAAERSQWSATDEVRSEADVVITTSASLAFAPEEDDGELIPPLPVLFLLDEPLHLNGSARSFPAWGALPQDTSASELCAAVRALSQGLVVGTPQLLFSVEGASPAGSPLTEREAEVLEWLARGLANKQIAAKLGISEHTVKFHVSSIYTKLNATNRTQAVREGLRNGWILL
jgi:DNA-binding NarL/FixJ family response regulator